MANDLPNVSLFFSELTGTVFVARYGRPRKNGTVLLRAKSDATELALEMAKRVKRWRRNKARRRTNG